MKRLVTLFLALVMTLALTGCGAKKSEETITFVLDWTPNTNHTGLYAAIAKGYFAEEGITVEVVQPPEDGAEMLVASGRAQFGVSFQDYLAPGLGRKDPLPITAVAAVVQHNTSGIISRAGEGMDTPAGLGGKKYATWDLPVEKATMQHVVEADGGDFSAVELIPSTVTDEVSALRSGSVDAIWVYYGWAGIACEVAGLETDYFAFADIDPVFDFYSPVIIGNDAYLKAHPEEAKAFVKALARGYTFAAEHPEEAAEILMEAAPELKSSEELVVESQKYLSQRYVDDAPCWGWIDSGRWDAFYGWLNEKGLVEVSIPAGCGFSNEYLPE